MLVDDFLISCYCLELRISGGSALGLASRNPGALQRSFDATLGPSLQRYSGRRQLPADPGLIN